MPNLLETIQDMNSVIATIPEIKTRASLSLEASSSKASSKFAFVKIDLAKVPLLSVGDDEGPLVIDVNASGLRKTKSGFMPKIIILSGLDKARDAKKSGSLLCNAWIGDKIIAKKIAILAPETVITSTMFACGPSSEDAMIKEKLLSPPNNGLAQGSRISRQISNYDFTNYGAPGSELNNPMLKLMLNVEEALTMYQKEKADGVHKVIYTPYTLLPPGLVNAGREATIAADAIGVDIAKFSVMDFLKWQHNKCTIKAALQTKNGLQASAYAYVGDVRDISTWQGRIDTRLEAAASLETLQYVPKSDKKEVRRIIIAAATCPKTGKLPCKCDVNAGGPGSGKHAFSVGKMSVQKSLSPSGSINNTVSNKCTVCGETKGHPNHEGMGVVKAEAGPHLGKGMPAKKHIDKINGKDKKKVSAVATPQTMNINSKKKK